MMATQEHSLAMYLWANTEEAVWNKAFLILLP